MFSLAESWMLYSSEFLWFGGLSYFCKDMAEGKGKRISNEQREIMLEFMMKNESLATGRFSAPDGAKHKARLLHELAEQLNSCASGVTKTDDKWLKSWQDWRSDVKSKAAALKKETRKTGGGQINPKIKPLTSLEEKLLSFLGPNLVTGHEEVSDPMNEGDTVDDEASVEMETGDSGDTISFPLDLNNLEPSSHNGDANTTVSSLEESAIVITVPSPTPSPTSDTSHISSVSAAKRRRRCSKGSSEDTEESVLLKISEKQINVLEEQNEINREGLEFSRRQTAAIESAWNAFCSAMAAMEKYFSRTN